MIKKRILGITAAILGLCLMFSGFYIKNRVEEGKKQIAEAQGNLDKGAQLFSFLPATKKIGKGVFSKMQNKLDEAIQKVKHYDILAVCLEIGGAIFIVAGSGILFVKRKNKHS